MSKKILHNGQIADLAMFKSLGVVNNEPGILGGSDFMVDVAYSTFSVRNGLLFNTLWIKQRRQRSDIVIDVECVIDERRFSYT